MSRLLDAKGRPVDPLESAMAAMYERLAEDMFGSSVEQRVHDLRRSILGDGAGQGPNRIRGLSEWLPVHVPVVVTGPEGA